MTQSKAKNKGLKIFEVVYGVGGIAYGGFNEAKVATYSINRVTGLLNEYEGEDVVITSIINTEQAANYEFENVISVSIL